MILNAYKWLVARLLVDSAGRVGDQLKSGKDGFTARNDSQAYFCRSLSLAFIEVSSSSFYIMPQKVAGYHVIPSEPFECLSITVSFPDSNFSIF